MKPPDVSSNLTQNDVKSKKGLIFILLFLATLLLLMNPYTFDFATSIIPGWHTTIFPPFFIASFLLIIILLIDSFIYWRLHKAKSEKSKTIVIIHFIFTMVMALLIKYPDLYFKDINPNYTVTEILNLLDWVKYASYFFVVLQILYFVYIIKVLSRK